MHNLRKADCCLNCSKCETFIDDDRRDVFCMILTNFVDPGSVCDLFEPSTNRPSFSIFSPAMHIDGWMKEQEWLRQRAPLVPNLGSLVAATKDYKGIPHG